MTVPSTMVPTPSAPVTVAMGETTDTASEFWQRVTGNVFVVYEGVPYALAQNILQNAVPDTAIALQLAAYPKRIAGV